MSQIERSMLLVLLFGLAFMVSGLLVSIWGGVF